ncbi:hypothetical protein NPIL_643061 [Nephila pilipes]|uniref:Uncharacterized protein n=1 Tax=Nephila pilipes TaxID=299642 RepID=A0A8X6QP70_NEPPI|nr:hypothetical protein NPIL_643061 [Nephila pilipes]
MNSSRKSTSPTNICEGTSASWLNCFTTDKQNILRESFSLPDSCVNEASNIQLHNTENELPVHTLFKHTNLFSGGAFILNEEELEQTQLNDFSDGYDVGGAEYIYKGQKSCSTADLPFSASERTLSETQRCYGDKSVNLDVADTSQDPEPFRESIHFEQADEFQPSLQETGENATEMSRNLGNISPLDEINDSSPPFKKFRK